MISINKQDITEEQFKQYVADSKTKVELATKVGFTYCNGRVHKLLMRLVDEYNCSIEHFDVSYKQKASAKYHKVQKICPECQGEFTTLSGGKKSSITCSYKCSNTYFYRHTELSKDKISKSLLKYNGFIGTERYRQEHECSVCKNKFTAPRDQKCCSNSCSSKLKWTDENYRINFTNKMKLLVDSGLHKGWTSRSKVKPSFPETYTMSLLDYLNITNYEREYKCGRWFIDFAIVDRKLALEIDGSQHSFPERKASDAKKDKYLIENGWEVLRIKWKKPNKEYREEVINKISRFFIR